MRGRFTLGQVLALTIAGLAAALLVLFWLVYAGSRDALLESASALHRSKSDEIAARVEAGLSATEESVLEVEEQLQYAITDANDQEGFERDLFAILLHRAELVELTFTSERGQVSLLRVLTRGVEHYVARQIRRIDDQWAASSRDLAPGAAGSAEAFELPDDAAMDPTEHPTYVMPQRYPGHAIWSDLSFWELDAMLPPAERRKVLTVQKAIYAVNGDFIGVVRAGLRAQTIDAISGKNAFICDRDRRLVTRISPDDVYETLDVAGVPDEDGDLRVVARAIPASIATALAQPVLETLDGLVQQSVSVAGQSHLLTFRPLPRTQGWVVGILAPESDYLGALSSARNRLLVVAGAIMLGLLGGVLLLLRSLGRDLGRLVDATERVGAFEFAPVATRSTFRDIDTSMESLERAKTALRSLGKYVPIALVRQLYDSQREPVLGGELQDVTISFSDIEGFTPLAEAMEPDVLAHALGRYLEVMTNVIQDNGGTIDKYIGDAIMTLWNTPRRLSQHPLAACRAALRCMAETRDMFPTRIGIHRATVMVGHYGAPTRFAFTAIGDGVNFASRLESLNKHYGTRILVSSTVAEEVATTMVLRRIDHVAVKGKQQAHQIFELCGDFETVGAFEMVRIARYEAALAHYFAGRFGEAATLFDFNRDDIPSKTMAARCRRLIADPPARWDGIYHTLEK